MIRLIRSYLFWTYERGSLHYDVMVTLILLFLFLAPRFIDFRDKPVANVPIHQNEVLIREAGTNGDVSRFVYEIRAEDLDKTATDSDLRASILHVVQPIAGTVTIESYKPVLDAKGKTIAYDATVLR
jgi:hypothetical protein